ncbi:hypothetical protein M0811_13941 [Anaeramoeba ignava]|uniref:Uncharacterized protein n=1 Tax=Anaeramoeba ignava TaxID=1746090 RepID=A0A9Q0LZC6_ANAIG|nr:hypothetical protein M0811_13941 [Anaeramoeba ignava]
MWKWKRCNLSSIEKEMELKYHLEKEIKTIQLDILKELNSITTKYHMVHVGRLLYREIIPALKNLVIQNGFFFYFTFCQGCLKPKKKKFLLKPQELKEWFSNEKEWKIHYHIESELISDGRFVSFILVEKLKKDD